MRQNLKRPAAPAAGTTRFHGCVATDAPKTGRISQTQNGLARCGKRGTAKMEKPRTAITRRELENEDWKTSLAKGQGMIPKGATVEILKMICNFYGEYYWVKYQGETYYVAPRDLELQECEKKCSWCFYPCFIRS